MVNGRGVLYYEYRLNAGSLILQADSVVSDPLSTTTEWNAQMVRFEGVGPHIVTFVYTAAGGGAVAALRGVRWEEEQSTLVEREVSDVRLDLRTTEIRKLSHANEILPFTYSSTNWIGVAGATVESKARIKVVQLLGSNQDVKLWNEEVPNTHKELVNKIGEGAFNWKAKKGVWKVSFDILNGNESIYQDETWFDLRKTEGILGFILVFY